MSTNTTDPIDDDIERRILAAYRRVCVREGVVYQQPSSGLRMNVGGIVELENASGVLATLRYNRETNRIQFLCFGDNAVIKLKAIAATLPGWGTWTKSSTQRCRFARWDAAIEAVAEGEVGEAVLELERAAHDGDDDTPERAGLAMLDRVFGVKSARAKIGGAA